MTNGNAQGSNGDAGQTAGAEGPVLKSSGARLKPRGANQVGIYFLCLAALTFYVLIATWPVVDHWDASNFAEARMFGFIKVKASADSRLFLTVATAGALGGLLHCITSFADYVGNRSLKQSWVWYLILRAPVGIALALLFYLALRGGLIAMTLPEGAANAHTATVLNPYPLAAVAAMAGMFSKQATDKLSEIFDTLFHPSKPVTRDDPLNPTPPVISTTEPARLTVRGPTQLAVIGRNFNKECTAWINGKQRDVKWESDTRVTITLLPEDVSAAGQLQVNVSNPAAAGGASAPLPVIVAPSA